MNKALAAPRGGERKVALEMRKQLKRKNLVIVRMGDEYGDDDRYGCFLWWPEIDGWWVPTWNSIREKYNNIRHGRLLSLRFSLRRPALLLPIYEPVSVSTSQVHANSFQMSLSRATQTEMATLPTYIPSRSSTPPPPYRSTH